MEEKQYILYFGNGFYVEEVKPFVEEDESSPFQTVCGVENLKKLVAEKIAKTDAKELSVFRMSNFFRSIFLDKFPPYRVILRQSFFCRQL